MIPDDIEKYTVFEIVEWINRTSDLKNDGFRVPPHVQAMSAIESLPRSAFERTRFAIAANAAIAKGAA